MVVVLERRPSRLEGRDRDGIGPFLMGSGESVSPRTAVRAYSWASRATSKEQVHMVFQKMHPRSPELHGANLILFF